MGDMAHVSFEETRAEQWSRLLNLQLRNALVWSIICLKPRTCRPECIPIRSFLVVDRPILIPLKQTLFDLCSPQPDLFVGLSILSIRRSELRLFSFYLPHMTTYMFIEQSRSWPLAYWLAPRGYAHFPPYSIWEVVNKIETTGKTLRIFLEPWRARISPWQRPVSFAISKMFMCQKLRWKPSVLSKAFLDSPRLCPSTKFTIFEITKLEISES